MTIRASSLGTGGWWHYGGQDENVKVEVQTPLLGDSDSDSDSDSINARSGDVYDQELEDSNRNRLEALPYKYWMIMMSNSNKTSTGLRP